MAYSQSEALPSVGIDLVQAEDGGVALSGSMERSELADRVEIKSASVETRPNSSDPLPPSMSVEIIGSPSPLPRKPDEDSKPTPIQKSTKRGLSVMKFCTHGTGSAGPQARQATHLRAATTASPRPAQGWRC